MTEIFSPLFLTDAEGQRIAVQIPYDIWESLAPYAARLHAASSASEEQTPQVPEPLGAFDELMQYWDFRYPYSPAVSCPNCGAAAEDWRTGEERPFRLNNANLGGLLVFRCCHCNATIRQKHFRDHVAFEVTPSSRS